MQRKTNIFTLYVVLLISLFVSAWNCHLMNKLQSPEADPLRKSYKQLVKQRLPAAESRTNLCSDHNYLVNCEYNNNDKYNNSEKEKNEDASSIGHNHDTHYSSKSLHGDNHDRKNGNNDNDDDNKTVSIQLSSNQRGKYANDIGNAHSSSNMKTNLLIVDKFAKPWERYTIPESIWCVPQPQIESLLSHDAPWSGERVDSIRGLIFVKIPKAASTTGTGISLQIAQNVAKRLGYKDDMACASQTSHGQLFTYRKEPYFMWSMIRDPAKRAVSSYFFFKVGHYHEQFDNDRFTELLEKVRNYQFNYIRGDRIGYLYPPKEGYDPIPQSRIMFNMKKYIMNAYNFIGIVERMEESLVVLQLLLNLHDEDIIVFSSKQSDGYDESYVVADGCDYLPKAYTTPEIDDFIETKFKENTTNVDYFLYDVINRSLDLTIDALGRDLVQEKIKRFRELRSVAMKACYSQTIFPCSDTGKRQPESNLSCISRDFACGHECIQNALQSYMSKNKTTTY